MANQIIQRPQTAAEALAPEIKGLLEHIDRSKRIRGERMEFESINKAILETPGDATPEERQQRIIGAIQSTRDTSRNENQGVLGRIFETFDPSVPTFDQTNPAERLFAQAGINKAVEDPRIAENRRLHNDLLTLRIAQFGKEGADKPLGATALRVRAGTLKGVADSVQSSFLAEHSPFHKGRKEAAFLEAFRDYTNDPTNRWQEENDTIKAQVWDTYVGLIVGDKDEETEFNPLSQEVQAFKAEVFGLTEQNQPAGGQPAVGTKPTGKPTVSGELFVPEGATGEQLNQALRNVTPNSQKAYAEVSKRRNEALADGNEADVEFWEKWMMVAMQAMSEKINKRTSPPAGLPPQGTFRGGGGGRFRGSGATGSFGEPKRTPVRKGGRGPLGGPIGI